MVMNLLAMQETRIRSLDQEEPLEQGMVPTPVFLPGEFQGQRSLEGCVHGVAEGRTQLSDSTFTFHFHALEEEMATHLSVLAWKTS